MKGEYTMHIEIPEKEFNQLSAAREQAMFCTFLLDLLENGDLIYDDEDYTPHIDQHARQYVLKLLRTALHNMQPALMAAACKQP